MTKKERALVKEFLWRMKASVGQHDQEVGDPDCIEDDKREWELFDALTALAEHGHD